MPRRDRRFEVTAQALLGIDFFCRLEHADRAHAARHCQGWCYGPRERIIEHRDGGRDVYFIQSGRVRASLLTVAGETIALQDLGSGEMFGELSALDGKPRSTSVEAVEESRVVRMPGPAFRDVLARFPSLGERVMLRLCALSRFLCERAVDSKALSVPDQIRLEICRIVCSHPVREDGSVVIEPAPTQEEIARFVGTRREQVSRVIGEYARELIERSRRRWVVRDVDAVCRRAR